MVLLISPCISVHGGRAYVQIRVQWHCAVRTRSQRAELYIQVATTATANATTLLRLPLSWPVWLLLLCSLLLLSVRVQQSTWRRQH
jgi:hypothetical protein